MAGSILEGKRLLAVDDEPDVLDTLEDILTGYTDLILDRATDYETGFHMLRSWTYDAVILDIMGVRGFDLLNAAVHLGFPTVMLTANALTVDNFKKSIEMGARAYIPKEKMADIDDFLVDVLTLQHTSSLKSSLKRLGSFFNRQFGSQWMEKEKAFWDRINAGDYEPKPVIFIKK